MRTLPTARGTFSACRASSKIRKGLPDDGDLTLQRLEKEVVHELGHTFGLRHCVDYRCVMYSSPAVEDIDVKNATFCASCRNDMAR